MRKKDTSRVIFRIDKSMASVITTYAIIIIMAIFSSLFFVSVRSTMLNIMSLKMIVVNSNQYLQTSSKDLNARIVDLQAVQRHQQNELDGFQFTIDRLMKQLPATRPATSPATQP